LTAYDTGRPAAPLFSGVGVALVTLFDGDGQLLVDETADHARRLIERGVASVTVAGTTGEAMSLTAAERAALCRATKDAIGGRVPVIVGTGHADRSRAVEFTVAAREAGADAVLALSPPAAANLDLYYGALAEAAAEIPVLAYHFPAVSPPGVPVERLSQLRVSGIKDSSGDAERLAVELEVCDYPVYVGSSAYLALAGPLGATGAILGLANTDPELCAAAFEGNIRSQMRLISIHLEVAGDFPAALKRRLSEQTGTSPAVRTPPGA
jgi:4-hydroxy-tetrahydrodipicolinate synthase